MNEGESVSICNLITGEESILHENTSIDSCTVEMLDYDKVHNTIVIDECFLLKDYDRGKSWFKAMCMSDAKSIHLITNKETEELIIKILKSLGRTNIKTNKYKKLIPLEINENIKLNNPPKKSLLIVFSRISVLKNKSIYENKNYNVSVLYGNLPPEVKKKEIERFINGETDICITTDVVGMGLNLPCEYVIFLEMEKYDGRTNRVLTNTEIKQIAGRAGRYGFSEKGYVGGRGIKNIIKALASCDKNNETYLGFDYKTVYNIPDKSMEDRIRMWSQADIIPDSLKLNIHKEGVEKYIKLINESIKNIEKENKTMAWDLLYCPVKDNNIEYFKEICNTIKNKQIIKPPYLHFHSMGDTTTLKKAEDALSKADLFMYLHNNKKYKDYFDENKYPFNLLKDSREILIIQITNYLLDKKMSNKKNCTSCGHNVGISWVHNKCEECYLRDRPKYYWNNYDDDDY